MTLITSMMPLIAFVLSVPCLVQGVSAQTELRTRYGAFAHVAFTTHDASFFRMPGTESCCAGFTGGSGTGLAGGLLAEFPLSSRMHVGARLALLTQPFSMASAEATRVIVNGNAQDGAFEHRLDGSLTTLGIEPLIAMRLFGRAYIHFGARVAFVLSSSYEQMDVITLPAGSGTFLSSDGTDSRKRTRNEFTGAVPSPSLQISQLIGVSYELPLNKSRTLLIVPEVFYQLGVTNVIADSTWKVNAFRAGIALKWSPADDPQQPLPPTESTKPEYTSDSQRIGTVPIPPPPAIASELRATLGVSGLDAKGNEVPTAKFVVEEYASTLMTPLLPYVFFDENAERLSTRYKVLQSASTQAFDIDAVNAAEKLPTYYHVLNIVGKRLRMYPDANIVVTGNNMDVRDEKGNTQLSARRAEAVKQYLTSVWGIAAKRITTDARSLPAKAANTQTIDGAEENRRAEIVSDDPRILAPIISNDTLRTANPPALLFKPSVTATAGISSWKLAIKQNDAVLRVFEGAGSAPGVIKWKVDDEKSSIPRMDAPVTATLTLMDKLGASTSVDASIDVEQITIRTKKQERLGDKVIDRFSLILFDVRSAELGAGQNAAIEIIRKHIAPTSSVSITGYSDRLGEARFNKELAESRAAAVASKLHAPNTSTSGIGQADLYDSSLPEGRLYTRTVNVVIETPIKN